MIEAYGVGELARQHRQELLDEAAGARLAAGLRRGRRWSWPVGRARTGR